MIRASAKNHAYVAIVTDPSDYAGVIEALNANDGQTPYAFRQKLAAKAYARTAAYDTAISNWFAEALDIATPQYRTIGGILKEEMRYGENPHQSAGFYVTGENRPGVATATLLQGKQLSYNNINDTDGAFELIGEFAPEKTPGLRHHQACQPLRRCDRPDAEGRLSAGTCLRQHVCIRRHYRAQPAARCRDGRRDRKTLHRSHHRA